MKAVIMAGGEGTRLRPVTGAMPKPMVPLLGRPMLEHIILLTKKHGYIDICAALKYRAEDIRRYFHDGHTLGVNLQYRVETTALGTAGGVKNCADFYGDDDFLVISGDAACDFDLASLMAAHRARGAAVTLALHRSSTPLSYGLAVTDSDSLVRCFIEKPEWSQVVTDLVNTGIYIVSPRAMALVPPRTPFDFARDLFPLLLSRGEALLGVPMDGYWCDVGSPLSYYQCCVDALEGRLNISPDAAFTRTMQPAGRSDDSADTDGECVDCRCRDRAALMHALSEAMLDMGADYSDGIHLRGNSYTMHIAPLSAMSAVRVSVRAEDAEFARSLALSARELITALDL